MRSTAIFAAAAALACAGCATFRGTQKDAFIDDEGNILRVEYGVSSREYTYKLVSPMNGAEIDGHDVKMVRVLTPEPENDKLTFYICQNPSPKGTMYETKDKKWKFLTVGIWCALYLWDPEEGQYLLVFEGDSNPAILEEDKARK